MGNFYVQPTPRTATFTVVASNSNDTRFADYVCTGTNDDVQIQAAINALPSTGGKIVLLDGTYTLGATVTIAKNNVTIQGVGKGTKITLANTKNVPLFLLGHATTVFSKCTFQDIHFDGNNANQTAGAIIDNFTSTNHINSLLIQACSFINAFNGAVIDFGVGGIVNDCFFYDNGGATNGVVSSYTISCCSFTINTRTTDILISRPYNAIGNVIQLNTAYNSAVIYGCSNVIGNTISQGNAVSFGASFIGINSSSCVMGNSIFGGNTPNNNAIGIQMNNGGQAVGNSIQTVGVGIAVLTFAECIISANVLAGIQTNAITVTGVSYCKISDNDISGAGSVTTNTYSGILISSGSTHNIINGNVILGNGTNSLKYGIRENTATENSNIVTSNQVLNAVTAQISLQGPQSIQANNITA